MKITLSLSLLVLLLGTTFAQKKVCRALAMSGGANRGAYEAGVAYGLAHTLPLEEASYDVVSGISAGSVNAFAMSLWAPEDTVQMTEWVVDMWRNLTSANVYQEWQGGFEEGLYNQSGILDDSPLVSYLTTVASQFSGFKRKITVGSVDVNTGNFMTFSDSNSEFSDYVRRVVASASIPVVFPHMQIDNMTLVDGGTRYMTNVASAVQRCMEEVEDESQIVIDVSLCFGESIDKINSTSGSAINNYLRYLWVSALNKFMDDITEVQRAFPRVNYRYLFMPSVNIGFDLLDFSIAYTEPMIQQGIKDAKAVIAQGEGVSFEKIRNWMDSEGEVRKRYGSFTSYLYEMKE